MCVFVSTGFITSRPLETDSGQPWLCAVDHHLFHLPARDSDDGDVYDLKGSSEEDQPSGTSSSNEGDDDWGRALPGAARQSHSVQAPQLKIDPLDGPWRGQVRQFEGGCECPRVACLLAHSALHARAGAAGDVDIVPLNTWWVEVCCLSLHQRDKLV
jgi:hypothetical protein